jgi:hypothetical protein
MDVGAAGGSLIFFSLIALLVLVSLAVLSYAAHSFLVVLVDTAAGNDEIHWPNEPSVDWIWKLWYLAWLVAVWAVPVSLVLEALQLPSRLVGLAAVGILWLIWPITLLSSLSALSRYVLFRPVILRELGKHFGATLTFYAVTWLLLPGCAVLVYLLVWGSGFPLLIGASVALAAGFLLYARLLGRLAWLLNRRKLGKRHQEAEEEEAVASPTPVEDPWAAADEEPDAESRAPRPPRKPSRRGDPSKKPKGRPRQDAYDPWHLPLKEPEKEVDWKKGLPADVVAQGIYGVGKEEAPPPPPPAFPVEDYEPLGVEALPPPGPRDERKPGKDEKDLFPPQVSEYEIQLAQKHREPPPPPFPMVTGIYTFLGYSATLGPLFTVALGFFLMALVLKGVQATFPL